MFLSSALCLEFIGTISRTVILVKRTLIVKVRPFLQIRFVQFYGPHNKRSSMHHAQKEQDGVHLRNQVLSRSVFEKRIFTLNRNLKGI